MTRPVATGLSHGPQADPQHAAVAVARALARAGLDRASSALLFLTPHYAANPEPAVRAAARAAGTLQITGCTGAGIFTDAEWLLDVPGAAAMVFAEPFGLTRPADTDTPRLSLCTPPGLSVDWFDIGVPRLGAVSADPGGQGPFCVYTGSRVADGGSVEICLANTETAIEVSQGVHALTAPIEVAEVHGLELLRLGAYPALNVLVSSLPAAVREREPLPLHLIMGGVTFGEPETAIRDGRYRLNHIVAANMRNHSITLSSPLARGERLFWAMRDTLAAERDTDAAVTRAQQRLRGAPDFALVFPCMGRGPQFFGNRDRDLDLLRRRYPELPYIGFYGNGEIGPLDGATHLYQYSTVIGLFRGRA